MKFLIKKAQPKRTVVYDTYWRLAAERQLIFFKRLSGDLPPWSKDAILVNFKFTNAYRASDRVSQFLIKEVIYRGDQSSDELLFRILLFKLFNKIETWKLLAKHFGEIRWDSYNFSQYSKVLNKAFICGEAIYSGAYIMASGKSTFGYQRKHNNHLKLLEQIMKSELAKRLGHFRGMEELYLELRKFSTIGSFLAYQYTTDINYSNLTEFSEMEFVEPGPGAKDGIRKCFSDPGSYSERDIIEMMADKQESEFERLGLDFKTLWGRPLQLIDCQNLFCEVDKYARVAHPDVKGSSDRTRIKQKFRVTSLLPLQYYFPPKWGLNVSNHG